MLSVTLYIMVCTARNRVVRRLRRLREPRYLIGAIVGSAYLFFAIFGRMRAGRAGLRRNRPRVQPALLPSLAGVAPAIGSMGVLLLAAISWVLPMASGLLAFTITEREFLFGAPISRRQLLLYRLIRSQWSVVFGALIFALLYPTATWPARAPGLLATWLFLMTCHLFITGVALTRTRARERPASAVLARWPQWLTFGALAVVALTIVQALRSTTVQSADAAFDLLTNVSQSPAVRVVLFPFAAIIKPLFAESLTAYLVALPAAVAVYAAAVAWVLLSDDVLDAVLEKAGDAPEVHPALAKPSYRVRSAAWTLGLTGRAEGAFVWKAAQQTFRRVDRVVVFRLVALGVWSAIAISLMSRTRGFAQVIAAFTGFASLFALLLGPQIFRSDLRQDLSNLDVLQTWPVRPAAVVRGEILWPAAIVTALVWMCGALSLFLSTMVYSRSGLQMRLAGGLALLVAAPAIVLAQYTIHNGVALLFPAWIPADGQRPRGVDAFGQRLILLGATWILLVLSLLPGAIAAGVLGLVFWRFVGPWILIPAAIVAGIIIVIEMLVATEALGPAYESLDMTSVERLE